jgi:hypothetical protein
MDTVIPVLAGTVYIFTLAEDPPEARDATRQFPDCPPLWMPQEAVLPQDALKEELQEGMLVKSSDAMAPPDGVLVGGTGVGVCV